MSNTNIQPYLLNAYRGWLMVTKGRCDIIVDVKGLSCPILNKVADPETGTVVLNIGYEAVRNLIVNDTGISFNCRIAGTDVNVDLEWYRVHGIKLPTEVIGSHDVPMVLLPINSVVVLDNGYTVMDTTPIPIPVIASVKKRPTFTIVK